MRSRTFAALIAGLGFTVATLGCGKSKPDSDVVASADPQPEPSKTGDPTPPSTPTPPLPNPGAGSPKIAPPTTGGPKTPTTPSTPPVGPTLPPFQPGGIIPMPSTGGGNPLPPVPPPPGGTDPLPKDPLAKDPPKDPKDPPKEPKEEWKWPTQVNGKPLPDYIRETSDPDPAVREFALRSIPQFGPAARREAIKAVITRMQRETDPGVRAAAYEAAGALATMGKDGTGREIGFDDEADTKEVVRLLYTAADTSIRGGSTRLHAIQTLASFGNKAEAAIPFLTGQNMTFPNETAYENRRTLAATLGMIGYNEHTGPNEKALNCLVTTLINDPSAAVRLAAFQSIVMLGPPWEALPPSTPVGLGQPKPPPKINKKLTAVYAIAIKKRFAPAPPPMNAGEKPSPTGLVERDKQVEIFARLALMRIEPEEQNDENFNAIARHIFAGETGVQLQALNAIGVMGEAGNRKLNDVVKALSDDNLNVVGAAVNVIAGMGDSAKPAIPALEKLDKRLEELKAEKLKDESFRKALVALKPEEVKLVLENMQEEQLRRLVAAAIKYIKEAKPAAPKP